MSALLYPSERPAPTVPTAPARVERVSFTHERLVVFLISFLVFAALGAWMTTHLHIVYADAESRLAHAYLVWWNRPAKLSAIGFTWPPMQTLSLLPVALVKPLATSLLALPVYSAVCGGVMMASLNATFERLEVGRAWRYPLLVACAANPLVLDYASNGMAEICTMMLLALGGSAFLRWYQSGGESTRALLASGSWMAAAFMSRYETAAWIVVMAAGVFLVKRSRGARLAEREGATVLFLAPLLYASAIWSLLNAAIIGGSPLGWLTRAGGQGQGNDQGKPLAHATLVRIAHETLTITGRVSPLLLLVPALLLVSAVAHRRRSDAIGALFVLLGPLTTILIVMHAPFGGLLQPRYNMRALPFAVIGAGWLLRGTLPVWWRRSAGLLLLGAAVAAIPVAVRTMRTYPHQYYERPWIHALSVGRTQDQLKIVVGFDFADDHRMAGWIDAHVHVAKSILVDESSLPGVVLQSGRPILFRTRVDYGDGPWLKALAHPWTHHVRYVVIGFGKTGSASYLTKHTFPQLWEGKLPGARLVFSTGTSLLYALAPARGVAARRANLVTGLGPA